MTDRKKPGVAFWATVAFSLPVLYVLSFGPACWLTAGARLPDRTDSFGDSAMIVYWPIGASVPQERTLWGDFVFWWGAIGMPNGQSAMIPFTSDGAGRFELKKR